jgi:hypothetical protein
VGRVVPEYIVAQRDGLGPLCDHAEARFEEAVVKLGRPGEPGDIHARLRVGRPVAGHRPRDPLGQFLAVRFDSSGLSPVLGGCHVVRHPNHLIGHSLRFLVGFRGSYKHLGASSYRCFLPPP